MASWSIGSTKALDEKMVTDYAISQVKRRISQENEAIFFYCSLCGAERTARLSDPGHLLFRDYTCADAHGCGACKTPATPRATRRPVFLRPGSLVSCPIRATDKYPWPAIVEDCPDGSTKFLIKGEKPNEVTSYFITFIFPNNGIGWVGGFMDAKLMKPFECKSYPSNCSELYTDSLRLAKGAIGETLGQRLKRFSFVWHVANQRRAQKVSNLAAYCSGISEKLKPSIHRDAEQALLSKVLNLHMFIPVRGAYQGGPSKEESPALGKKIAGAVAFPNQSLPVVQKKTPFDLQGARKLDCVDSD